MSNGSLEFRPEDATLRGNTLHIGGSTYALGTISDIHLADADKRRSLVRWFKITLACVVFTALLAGLMEAARHHLDSALLSALGIMAIFLFYPFLMISAGLVLASIVMFISASSRPDDGRTAILTIVFANGSRRGARGTPAELGALKAALEDAMRAS